MNIQLKVKICTLMAESHIIRTQQKNLLKRAGHPPSKSPIIHDKATALGLSEELKTTYRELRLEKKLHKAKIAKIKMGKFWPSLQAHRKGVVRRESRHSFVAYAFLRNQEYSNIERFCYQQPDWAAVEKIVNRFTTEPDKRIVAQRFEEWKQRGRQNQDDYKNGQQAAQASDNQTRLSA